ncbi:PTS transporter subunit EIIC [Enterococcus sp. AZ072]|uniref:PTS transporter subunit EIIC n=1 Tax=unclassified Enterococcus TaxID=2608891 RepID=UPI003D2A76AA
MNYQEAAPLIIDAVGGTGNVDNVTHCMTRLRFVLRDDGKADDGKVKNVAGVMGVTRKGGQYQLIIGPNVASLYDVVEKLLPAAGQEQTEEQTVKHKKDGKAIFEQVLDYISGSLTPLIPILLVASLCKTVGVVLGPSLLGLVTENSDIYQLFTFVGDAGFYFLPVFIGWSAARKLKSSIPIGMLLGAVMLYPNFMQMAEDSVSFSVYGIPTMLQNYSSTVLPMILTIAAMSFVEKFWKRYTPDVLKVFLIPFGTLLVMLPLTLIIFGPLGGFLGVYIGEALIALNTFARPLAVCVVGATFAFIVMTGMHPVLFTYLFTTFPALGYDNFLMPGILAASWAGTGVALACVYKFKSKEKKTLTFGYVVTWFLGGVGEPLLYGLNVPYKTPFVAGTIAGAITGLIAGILNLTGHVLNISNGIYGLAGFVGGSTYNYIVLGVTVAAGLISGFVVMLFFKLDEGLVKE